MQNLSAMFKSVIEQDDASVVICDTEHIVVYMNKAAILHYGKRGGENIVGHSIFDCHNDESRRLIEKVVGWFAKSCDNNKVHTFYNPKQNKDVYMIALRDDVGKHIGDYEKHEFRDRDTSAFYAID